MRPVLQNQPQIGRLSYALLESLKVLVSAIGTGWRQQHDGDGAHTDVTADSVTAPVIRSQGRLVSSRIAYVNTPTLANSSPLFPWLPAHAVISAGAGGTFFDVLKVRTSSTVGATVIHGIDSTGREEGDRILICNVGNANLTLKLSSVSTAPAGTQFTMDANLTPLVFGELTIGTGGIVEAVYMHVTFYNKKLWLLTAVREV